MLHFFPKTIISSASMTGNITSSVVDVTQDFFAGIQAVYTGSPVGAIELQCSNDQTTWTSITGSSNAVSGASNTYWNIKDISFPYLRVVYTFTSGTGSLTVKALVKGP